MRLPKFEYKKAVHLEEALGLYSHYEERAVFLAGGTDIVPRMKLRLEKPVAVIDLKGVRELEGIRKRTAHIRIGALTSLYEVKQDSLIKEHFPSLWEALEATSSEMLQMRGSLGGNLLQETRCLNYNQSEFWRDAMGHCLKVGGEECKVVGGETCFSNYCSDTAVALLSLSAGVKIVGPRGERKLPLFELYSGNGIKPFNLSNGEIMTEILIPRVRTKGGYEKLRLRKSIDYPLLGVAFSKSQEKGILSVGAIGPKPSVVALDELSQRGIEEAAQSASDCVRPVKNAVVPPSYRKRMVKVITLKLMRRILRGM